MSQPIYGLPYKFGCLMPIKIVGNHLAATQLESLTEIAGKFSEKSLHKVKVFLGIDAADRSSSALNEIELIFSGRSIQYNTIYFDTVHKGKICHYWRILADAAVGDGCDFFVLLGDDVIIHTKAWMDCIVQEFENFHRQSSLPSSMFGFGCLALNDLQAPGFPTFPVLHKLHYALHDELFSDKFINQDADPFLYQLYRRFGAARFSSMVDITNSVGGVQLSEDIHYIEPRYNRLHLDKWSGALLDDSVKKISSNIIDKCNLSSLDNPDADLVWLRELIKQRKDIRMRVNDKNNGASFTRNVGLDESASEYVLFLDDDVVPDEYIVDRYAEAARKKQNAKFDGFVGFSDLPISETRIFPTAVHLSGVSFFWRAAKIMKTVPWGITANLFVRRSACGRFDLRYIKTGGGEDIAFCLELGDKRSPLLSVPEAIVEHPWWDNGNRCYHHFFNWAKSDGELQDIYPDLTYYSALNAIETSIIVLLLFIIKGLFFSIFNVGFAGNWLNVGPLKLSIWAGLQAATLILFVDVLLDLYKLFYLSPLEESYSRGWNRFLAIIESNFIKNVSIVGRIVGHYQRGRLLTNFCNRFDWFCGSDKHVVANEKTQNLIRFTIYLIVTSVFYFGCL